MFKAEWLNALTTLVFNDGSFPAAQTVTLQKLPKLNALTVGGNALAQAKTVTFEGEQRRVPCRVEVSIDLPERGRDSPLVHRCIPSPALSSPSPCARSGRRHQAAVLGDGVQQRQHPDSDRM